MKENRIKKLTTLSETKFLSLYDAEYENKGGKRKHWIIASRKENDILKAQIFDDKAEAIDAVVIASLHKATGCLVLIRQFRVPLNDYVYELPAGLLENSEAIEEAVSRELKEETGLSLSEIIYGKSRKKTYISAGMTDESVALVYCICEGEVSKDYLEEDEDIEALLISQEKAIDLLKEDIKIDIKALIMLQHFAYFGGALF